MWYLFTKSLEISGGIVEYLENKFKQYFFKPFAKTNQIVCSGAKIMPASAGYLVVLLAEVFLTDSWDELKVIKQVDALGQTIASNGEGFPPKWFSHACCLRNLAHSRKISWQSVTIWWKFVPNETFSQTSLFFQLGSFLKNRCSRFLRWRKVIDSSSFSCLFLSGLVLPSSVFFYMIQCNEYHSLHSFCQFLSCIATVKLQQSLVFSDSSVMLPLPKCVTESEKKILLKTEEII